MAEDQPSCDSESPKALPVSAREFEPNTSATQKRDGAASQVSAEADGTDSGAPNESKPLNAHAVAFVPQVSLAVLLAGTDSALTLSQFIPLTPSFIPVCHATAWANPLGHQDQLAQQDPGPAPVPRRKSKRMHKMRPGDWFCDDCQDVQFARNTVCRQCGQPAPPGCGEVEKEASETDTVEKHAEGVQTPPSSEAAEKELEQSGSPNAV
mmetsp:Transcript_17308/g.41222  ORF Transcript_17308/g.41222 Transcript_17308/m.41222 type:complete len:209 (-) Transcript_17308:73-699(-)